MMKFKCILCNNMCNNTFLYIQFNNKNNNKENKLLKINLYSSII